ncbi:MAG: aminoglycoside phosphotransferase [Pseudonocardiaceae bacterium]|nr:aminoglycoside phosphotransferase [Pseudonocardiaceae bacterium]
MSANHSETTEADRQFTLWMRSNLHAAADHFDVAVSGEPVMGWRLRSISAPVERNGADLWLRVVSEQVQYAEGDWWTGNVDANAITGIAKPRVLDTDEWEIPNFRRQQAELMTRMAGTPISPTDVLRYDPPLPTSWWDELRHSLDQLAAMPTQRLNHDEGGTKRAREARGPDIPLPPIERWETVHGDLQWANILRPFALLDWEFWGRGVAGTDPATLYCYSLLAPRTADIIWNLFADILDTDNGRNALLHVSARLLHRTTNMDDHPDLEQPLRRLVARIS